MREQEYQKSAKQKSRFSRNNSSQAGGSLSRVVLKLLLEQNLLRPAFSDISCMQGISLQFLILVANARNKNIYQNSAEQKSRFSIKNNSQAGKSLRRVVLKLLGLEENLLRPVSGRICVDYAQSAQHDERKVSQKANKQTRVSSIKSSS